MGESDNSRKGCAALVLDRYLRRRAGVARIRQAWLPLPEYASLGWPAAVHAEVALAIAVTFSVGHLIGAHSA